MKYFIFLFFVALTSCSKEKSQSDVIDIGVDILVFNNNGENLLLQSTPNYLNPDSIQLTYQINGVNYTVYNANLDCPKGFCYLDDAGKERIGITPNDTPTETYPITYIEWGNGDTDTLKCHFIRKDNGSQSTIVCDQAWFNGVLVFPDSAIAGLGRAFKIVK